MAHHDPERERLVEDVSRRRDAELCGRRRAGLFCSAVAQGESIADRGGDVLLDRGEDVKVAAEVNTGSCSTKSASTQRFDDFGGGDALVAKGIGGGGGGGRDAQVDDRVVRISDTIGDSLDDLVRPLAGEDVSNSSRASTCDLGEDVENAPGENAQQVEGEQVDAGDGGSSPSNKSSDVGGNTCE